MSRRAAYALDALLVIIWASTWVAIKIGLEDAPALLGAGIRFTATGALLLAFAAARRRPLTTDKTLALTLGLLPFAFCYGLVYDEAITGRAVAGAALVVAGLLAARGRGPAAVRRRVAPERIAA
jgi:drug/metabolite transporter (DMT)-like permease